MERRHELWRGISVRSKYNAQQADICQNGIDALAPPSDIPELAELKSAELTALNLVRQLLSQVVTAAQHNDTEK